MSARLGRLRYRSEFLRVAAARRRYATSGIVVQVLSHTSPSDQCKVRVGYTVTKRVGNAVVRNYVRRRLRGIANSVLPNYAMPGHDFVILGQPDAAIRPYASLVDDLDTALRKLNVWRACCSDIETSVPKSVT